MKRNSIIITSVLVGTLIGVGAAVLQDRFIFPFLYKTLGAPEERYTVIRGVVSSSNSNEDTITVRPANNTSSAGKRVFRITPRTKLFPFTFSKTEGVFTGVRRYPFILGGQNDLTEGVWISGLVYEKGDIDIVVELYYETEPENTINI